MPDLVGRMDFEDTERRMRIAERHQLADVEVPAGTQDIHHYR